MIALDEDATARRAVSTAASLGERLLFESRSAEPSGPWRASRGLIGSSGFALTFAALAEATGESRFEAAMHDQLRRAARVEDVPAVGLMGGISGLRAAAAVAVRHQPRYARLVAQCDAFVQERLPRAPFRAEYYDDYDVAAGWAGVRLARCIASAQPRDATVEYLAWLMADETRWCLPHPLTRVVQNDLGLAHGIAGVLATLALTVDAMDDELIGLARAAAWRVARSKVDRDDVPAWPMSFQSPPQERYRAAWCYGAAGIASSLFVTARALKDSALEVLALGVLSQLAELPNADCLLADEAICHGTAGNALIFASVAAATGDPAFHTAAMRLVDDTIAGVERNDGRCLVWKDDGSERIAVVGEPTGLAGVVLTLLTIAGACDAAWMRCHALRPLR